MVILPDCDLVFNKELGVFFVESNGEEPTCPICGGSLKYRDSVPRIMKRYNGEKAYVMIERRRCQNPDCRKLHRCLPSQLTKFKHFLTEIIEDTVDDVVIPEDPEQPGDEYMRMEIYSGMGSRYGGDPVYDEYLSLRGFGEYDDAIDTPFHVRRMQRLARGYDDYPDIYP